MIKFLGKNEKYLYNWKWACPFDKGRHVHLKGNINRLNLYTLMVCFGG